VVDATPRALEVVRHVVEAVEVVFHVVEVVNDIGRVRGDEGLGKSAGRGWACSMCAGGGDDALCMMEAVDVVDVLESCYEPSCLFN
jgi:hypothetical protein